MITRSKRDSSYEYFELPDTKRKRQKKEKTTTATTATATTVTATTVTATTALSQTQSPNITVTYIERPFYEVNIDFDEAHCEWVKNKVKLQNGCYRYKNERKNRLLKNE